MAILTANAIEETHSSAWLQLEGTDQSLPLFRSTTTGILDEELLTQDSHGSPLLKKLQIFASSCIMLWRAAAKEFRGSIVEVGAKTQTLTAQFTGCIHTFYTPPSSRMALFWAPIREPPRAPSSQTRTAPRSITWPKTYSESIDFICYVNFSSG